MVAAAVTSGSIFVSSTKISSAALSTSSSNLVPSVSNTYATTTQIPRNFYPAPTPRRSNLNRKISHGVSFLFPSALSRRSLSVRAAKSKIDDSHSTPFTVKQDDLGYLLKLGGGSLLGAAAIKYGSALFPVITTPNILQALTMIFAPVIVAVLLLIKKSSAE